ncbi:efflux protein [Kwoniella heveanensis CBS 569]|nr:efflux protein [Kwoniella heveanensis CBS 569]
MALALKTARVEDNRHHNESGEKGNITFAHSEPAHGGARASVQRQSHSNDEWPASPAQPQSPHPGPAPPTPLLLSISIPTLSKTRQITLAITLTFTMLMCVSGMQALNIGLPTIQRDLHMQDTDLQWIVSAYSLTNGCLLLLSGRIADIYGRKKVLMAGMGWWALWSLIGGFMQNGAGLVTCRAMAGCGAAMSIPSATGIIAHNYTGKARANAYALFSAGAPLGGALGLIIGGLFVAYVEYSWRSALFFLAGLGALGLIAVYFLVPADVSYTEDRRVDWIGAGLVTIGLVLLQFAISDGQIAPQGWKTSYIIVLLILGPFLIVAFFFWEKHIIDKTTRPPLMRLQLWTRARGRLASVYLVGFLSWLGFHSLFYHATLFFQEIQNTGPVGAMVRFLPTEISGIICNIIVALIIHRISTVWLLSTGLLATGLANMCLALSQQDTNYWVKPFHAMWLSVMGADFFFAPALIFVAYLSLPDEQSVASALLQTIIQLGGSFGISITSVLADVQQNKYLARGYGLEESKLQGLKAAFWLGSATCFAGMIVAVLALHGLGRVGKEETKSEEGLEGGTREERRVFGSEKGPEAAEKGVQGT